MGSLLLGLLPSLGGGALTLGDIVSPEKRGSRGSFRGALQEPAPGSHTDRPESREWPSRSSLESLGVRCFSRTPFPESHPSKNTKKGVFKEEEVGKNQESDLKWKGLGLPEGRPGTCLGHDHRLHNYSLIEPSCQPWGEVLLPHFTDEETEVRQVNYLAQGPMDSKCQRLSWNWASQLQACCCSYCTIRCLQKKGSWIPF